jgi:thiamine biosynthesis lipoprotein
MNTTVNVYAVGAPAAALDEAEALVHRCERRWSRFLATSELSRLNAAAGHPVVLDRHTYELVVAAVECWQLTAGRFDPTVAHAMSAAGYDRSLETASRVIRTSSPAPGCADIVLDDALAAVTLPAGVALDLGGIAKGHTADLVVERLLDLGASGAIADLGGDIRVEGLPPHGDAWSVRIEDPMRTGTTLRTVAVAGAGVATSSVMRRRWRHGDSEAHHIIDPATGAPAATSLAAVTVLAGTAAWAEVTAKAALVAGVHAAALVVAAAGATGLLVHRNGMVTNLDGLEAFV